METGQAENFFNSAVPSRRLFDHCSINIRGTVQLLPTPSSNIFKRNFPLPMTAMPWNIISMDYLILNASSLLKKSYARSAPSSPTKLQGSHALAFPFYNTLFKLSLDFTFSVQCSTPSWLTSPCCRRVWPQVGSSSCRRRRLRMHLTSFDPLCVGKLCWSCWPNLPWLALLVSGLCQIAALVLALGAVPQKLSTRSKFVPKKLLDFKMTPSSYNWIFPRHLIPSNYGPSSSFSERSGPRTLPRVAGYYSGCFHIRCFDSNYLTAPGVFASSSVLNKGHLTLLSCLVALLRPNLMPCVLCGNNT